MEGDIDYPMVTEETGLPHFRGYGIAEAALPAYFFQKILAGKFRPNPFPL
jgi:hypothetical protein